MTQYYLDVNTEVPEVIEQIKQFANETEFKGEKYTFEHFMFRRWSMSVDWYAYSFVETLSKKFPDYMFSLRCSNNITYFYMNGYSLSNFDLWPTPRFPVLSKFNVTKKAKIKDDAIKEAKRKEQYRLEAEAKKQQEIKELEMKLASLKGG